MSTVLPWGSSTFASSLLITRWFHSSLHVTESQREWTHTPVEMKNLRKQIELRKKIKKSVYPNRWVQLWETPRLFPNNASWSLPNGENEPKKSHTKLPSRLPVRQLEKLFLFLQNPSMVSLSVSFIHLKNIPLYSPREMLTILWHQHLTGFLNRRVIILTNHQIFWSKYTHKPNKEKCFSYISQRINCNKTTKRVWT